MDSLYIKDAELERIKASIRENSMPEISVEDSYGKLLSLLVKISGAKKLLEIGALGGYSGLCLLRGLEGEGSLTSLELKQEFADVAHANLKQAGFKGRVEYRIGEALTTLQELENEGRTFDFFFIDADKGNYPNYLEWAIRLANPGAVIVGDNLVMRGRIFKAESTSPSVQAMKRFNEMMAADSRLEGVLLPAYDGLAIARVKTKSND
ncbi:O-methyltransferase [Paenibacillus turpanensis]|uniref:O-methyltransferase n=1 Tax=Paenibacillus turpanensis TaxID=2689078 RepID=UPI00140CE05C|nr:O-methyltransferase [Paenibacillus turpanensis]